MYSLFMHDESYNNHGYEHMLDYQMSWVMRVAARDEIKKNNPVLHKRCFNILMKLLEKNKNDSIIVNKVQVWKQWKRIDVIAHVEIQCNGKDEKHVIILEDKAYTMIHDDQLRRYEATVKNAYDNDDDLKQYQKHYWVITFFGKNKDGVYENGYVMLRHICETEGSNWKVLSYEDILDDYSPTGSEQFDDFWINDW